MQETAQNHHMHKYNGGQAKRKGRSIKRQCVTCLAWDKWRTYRAPRPDLTAPTVGRHTKRLAGLLKNNPVPEAVMKLHDGLDAKPMTKAEMVEHDVHVNILADSARDPNTGYPLKQGDPLKDAAMSQRGAELLAMTVPELYKVAKGYDLKVTTKTKKAELISLIDQHETSD